MKILIVAPSRKMGGIERALSVLATEWAKQGFNVVYVSCLKSEPFYKLHESIKIIEPNFMRVGGFVNKSLFYPRLLLFIRKTVKENKPERVLVFGDWFCPITLLALYGTKVPVYISDRTIPNYPFKFPIPQLKKWLYPKSAGFIAQTNRSMTYKKKMFGNKLNIRVIPNALSTFDQINTDIKEKSYKILYVGRFEWEKDPEILIRAFAEMSFEFPDWTLEMAGDGPLFEKMKDLAMQLKIFNKIVFHGKVKNVQKLYNEASIFVLPSVIEGFPNALIEAMSFGLPCICFSDIPYEDIVIDEFNGFVLNERNPKTLSTLIQLLIKDPNRREEIGTRAIKNVNSNCNPAHISKKIIEFMNFN
jgi:GalNAc-alpha-(1->4)-GalNAc-alpha-(1->3)-diNAcBac-PP-undecaprenol alpha-1,4-N-acetyl-D-galactosaminyltransferase